MGRVRQVAVTVSGFAGILVIWQYGARFTRLPAYILPVPTVIAARFWQTLAIQAHHLGVTAMTTMIGTQSSSVRLLRTACMNTSSRNRER